MLRKRTYYTEKGHPYAKAAVGDVLCSDLSVVKFSAWPAVGKTAIGVVIKNENQVLLVISLSQDTASIWGTNGAIATLPYIDAGTEDSATADGRVNTTKIIEAGKSNSGEIGLCRTYSTAGTSPGDWDAPSIADIRGIDVALVSQSLVGVVGDSSASLDRKSTWLSDHQGNSYAYLGIFSISRGVSFAYSLKRNSPGSCYKLPVIRFNY